MAVPERNITLAEYANCIARLMRTRHLRKNGGLFFETAAVTAELFDADHAAILIPVGDDQREVVGCHGQPSMPLRREHLLGGIVGRAFRTCKPQLVSDVGKDNDYDPFDPSVKSELAVPISDRSRNAVEMVINLESYEPGHFHGTDAAIVGSLGEAVLEFREILSEQSLQVYRDSELAKILDDTPDEILVIDQHFRPIYANRVKRDAFPRLKEYLDAHPIEPGWWRAPQPSPFHTCHWLIEKRSDQCSHCVCSRSMNTNDAVQGCYRPKNLGFTVELSAYPLREQGAVRGCIEVARKITQREAVLDHAPELVEGVTEDHLLSGLMTFLHYTMRYDRVRLYSLDATCRSMRGVTYRGTHSRISLEEFAEFHVPLPDPIAHCLVTGKKTTVIQLDGDSAPEESLGYWRVHMSSDRLKRETDPKDILELGRASEIIGVPLQAEDRRWVVFIDSGDVRQFAHDDLQALSMFARIADAALLATLNNRSRFVMAILGEATAGLLHVFASLAQSNEFEANVYEPFAECLRSVIAEMSQWKRPESRCLAASLAELSAHLEPDKSIPARGEPEVIDWADALSTELSGTAIRSLILDIAQIGPRKNEDIPTWVAAMESNARAAWPKALSFLLDVVQGLKKHAEVAREVTGLADNIRGVLPQQETGGSQSESTDMKGLVNLVVETLRVRARKQEVAIEWESTAEPIVARVKKSHLFMALLALADNAIRAATVAKASSQEGRVSVALTMAEHEIHIAISNNGDRVPPEKVPLLFKKPFTTRERDSRPGTGLGLILASHWIGDDNGQIVHSYDAETNRTTFEIIGQWGTPVGREFHDED